MSIVTRSKIRGVAYKPFAALPENPAGSSPDVMRLPSSRDLGAVGQPGCALPHPVFEKAVVDERPIVVGLVQRIADAKRLSAAQELVAHGGSHASVDDHVAAARAALAGSAERGPERSFHRQLEIGIGQDDERILAAELERRNLQIAPADFADLAADRGRAGERDLVQQPGVDRFEQELSRAAGAAP